MLLQLSWADQWREVYDDIYKSLSKKEGAS